MNWHKPTKEDVNGDGDHRWIIDIIPDHVPHQATTDGNALIRVAKHGWAWQILDVPEQKWVGEIGYTDTKEEAIGAAMSKLAELRS